MIVCQSVDLVLIKSLRKRSREHRDVACWSKWWCCASFESNLNESQVSNISNHNDAKLNGMEDNLKVGDGCTTKVCIEVLAESFKKKKREMRMRTLKKRRIKNKKISKKYIGGVSINNNMNGCDPGVEMLVLIFHYLMEQNS